MTGMPAAKAAQKKLMPPDAWLRLALLVVPLAVVVEAASAHAVWCVCGCAAVLAVWLNADFGPFQARAASAKPAVAESVAAPARRPLKVSWWNQFVCRSLIVFAFVLAKLTA